MREIKALKTNQTLDAFEAYKGIVSKGEVYQVGAGGNRAKGVESLKRKTQTPHLFKIVLSTRTTYSIFRAYYRRKSGHITISGPRGNMTGQKRK